MKCKRSCCFCVLLFLPHGFLFDTSTRRFCGADTTTLSALTLSLSCLISRPPLLMCFRRRLSKVRLFCFWVRIRLTGPVLALIWSFTHKLEADLPLDCSGLMLTTAFFPVKPLLASFHVCTCVCSPVHIQSSYRSNVQAGFPPALDLCTRTPRLSLSPLLKFLEGKVGSK